MLSKKQEIELYSKMYLYAFERDRLFFYNNDSPTIYTFLRENYWGDSLALRMKVLVNLLDCDSSVHPRKIKKELIRKSKELNTYLSQLQESDLSVSHF